MAERKKLTEDEIGGLVQQYVSRSIDYDRQEYRSNRVKAIEYVRGELRDVPADEGTSQITSSDVGDVIGWILPGLMRVFFAGDNLVTYEPHGPEDEESAAQATDYVNYILTKELDGYRIFNGVFYDSLLHGNGVVKHWWEPYEKATVHIFHNLTEAQAALILSEEGVEVLEQDVFEEVVQPEVPQTPLPVGNLPQLPPMVTNLYNLKVKKVESTGCLKVVVVPPEEFLIDAVATCIEDAKFVAQRTFLTRSELIEKGFDEDLVYKLPAFGGDLSFDRVQVSRREQIGSLWTSSGIDSSTDEIEIIEAYVKCDYNGDGIAETLQVFMGGSGTSVVLDWQEWEGDYPFSDFIAEPVPHRWLGRSVFNEVEDVQRVKTVLIRQMLNNLYQSNIPDRIVDEERIINPDSLYDRQIGNVIRVNGDPASAVFTTSVPFIAGEALKGLQYMDEVVERRTGASKATMALDLDALQHQTATAVNAAQTASYSKIELIARNFAEMGFKRFFKCLLKLVVQNQDMPRTVRLRNKWVEYDPRGWNASMDTSVSVGLGSGSRDKDLMMLQQIAAKQEQIIAQSGPTNPISGVDKYVTTLRKMVEVSGIKNTEQFFNEITPEALQQLSQPQQQQPDPEVAKAQAEMQVKQQKAQFDAQQAQQKAQADFALEQQKMAAELQAEREKNAMTLQVTREKHELDMQMAREKAEFEIQHKREVALLEAQLRREEMQIEAQITREANAMKIAQGAQGGFDTNIVKADLSE
ncbi:portal protein [Phyllobacterium sophorae]|uniref:Portal protein n=1 Tax=Phyllobacterium sophorae TaxID=1520277 RepID=A0A2P7BDY5_9HYPH|nr:hypothetical protein [Phyllobacterium sophorae]PSH64668.1 hypothetical protein CU103_12355 [Phyllobacterium sophorae]